MPMPRNPKYDTALIEFNAGMTVKELAEKYGITTQVMGDNLRRRGAKLRGDFPRGPKNNMYTGLRAKRSAQKLVELAVRQGRIVPQEECSSCGDTKRQKNGRSNVHAHHPDYTKPLEVVWLCRKCHVAVHKQGASIGALIA